MHVVDMLLHTAVKYRTRASYLQRAGSIDVEQDQVHDLRESRQGEPWE
jgi:hypothetical protein